jgi:hypothetical protein
MEEVAIIWPSLIQTPHSGDLLDVYIICCQIPCKLIHSACTIRITTSCEVYGNARFSLHLAHFALSVAYVPAMSTSDGKALDEIDSCSDEHIISEVSPSMFSFIHSVDMRDYYFRDVK